MKSLILRFFVGIGGLILLIPIVLAATAFGFDGTPSTPPCALEGVMSISIHSFATLETGETWDWRNYLNGSQVDGAGPFSYDLDSPSWGVAQGVAYPYTSAGELSLYLNGVETERWRFEFTCTDEGTGTGVTYWRVFLAGLSSSHCPVFFDGRINNCDTGNWIVIYPHSYDSGDGLVITDTEGNNLLLVTPEQIAAVPECPDSNTLIASGGGVDVYRLAGSCEYVVVGPATDGKHYYVLFDELYANTGYESFEE